MEGKQRQRNYLRGRIEEYERKEDSHARALAALEGAGVGEPALSAQRSALRQAALDLAEFRAALAALEGEGR